MNYKVTFENRDVVKIKLKKVSFSIEKETGVLYELINTGDPVDVVIPHIFPSGHQIKCLYSQAEDEDSKSWEGWKGNMVKGVFNEITISDNIFVGCGAFQGAKVKKIIWNDCPCIPSHCFQSSKMEEIASIEDVKQIHPFAFAFCGIKGIAWPEHCNTIPACCFDGSNLIEINNISGVTSIGEFAFSSTKLSTLDLSDTNISYLVPWALDRLPDECKLTLPYYINSEVCDSAIEI